MTRAFVAVRPPEAVLDEVDALAASLHLGDARRTSRAQWHVTLQFLGNRAEVDAVTDALRGIDVPTGMARLGGLGAFPNAKRARIVWLGLAEGEETLGALAREVGARLTPLGHAPEARAYHAHLTLARLKTPADVRPALTADAAVVGASWLVEEVTVYESVLRRAGAEYVARAAVGLRGSG